ncbi:urea amidohydrolase (urease) alpha subunit [Fusarium sp. NRRL 25303]|nr:urea amidohydrolase (urease) alpha subunit [Fusarium sp. NRRL 25303]
MHYTPREVEKLLFSQAGRLAQRRLAHGKKLNHLESSALIATVLQEIIHNEDYSVADLMKLGKRILGRRHVHPSVVGTLKQMQVEGTFKTGTHLITIHNPISTDDGDLKMALYGSFLAVPSHDLFPAINEVDFHPLAMPGAIRPAETGDIILNAGSDRVRLTVTNKGTRAVYIGSHFHFMETNPHLDFDREKAYGYHLDLPAGEFLRFEPNEPKKVTLVQIGGSRIIQGGSGYAKGPVDPSNVQKILRQLQQAGYRHSPEESKKPEAFQLCSISREKYASAYGPTTGDLIRLGSTDLWIKVEKDYTSYGDECTLGCGKTIRDGMGAASGCSDADCLDLAIINAVIIDWTGIFKADIGVKDGAIVSIGKAGNPATMDGVSDNMVIGSNTDIIDAGGKIVTAGGIDTHVHNICPQQAFEAISSGITTLFGGGTGPSTSSTAVNGTASKKYIRQMMQACDQLPLNFGLVGKGSDSERVGLLDQIKAGVIALKLHEDFGCTPSTIDNCLNVCEEQDIQCHIHTDGLNEAGFLEHTAAIFKGRSIHVYHVEGAGGGHAPDVIKLVAYPNVLPSSTTPTMPFTTNTIDEHIDMAANCHRLSKDNPDDASFLKNRIREETISAEDILHDIGAISIMSSDSQAMGRSAEVLTCTWKAAHKNKAQRGPLDEDKDTGADNYRVKRYISKYTVNPAITQGISHAVGSVEAGKLADLVIWDPAEFGTKPFQVLKKGFITYAQMGDPNGAVADVEPLIGRPMYGALHPESSVMFVSQASIAQGGDVHSYGLKKQIEVVKNCRTVKKSDLKYNSATPKVEVDPETLVVTCDGKDLRCRTLGVDMDNNFITDVGLVINVEPAKLGVKLRMATRRVEGARKQRLRAPFAHSPTVNHASHDTTFDLDNSFETEDIQAQHTTSHEPTIFAETTPVLSHQSQIPYHQAPTLGSVATTTQLQFSKSLDDTNGSTSILLGASSESDPWLLRHCQFDEYGLRSFFGLQFRNIGGVPNRQKIPVHFIVRQDETNVIDSSLRTRLNDLIPASWGLRLIRLFYKHVYPIIPIISSTYFTQELLSDLYPAPGVFDHVPCHLLGAMYGLAMPFARNDDHLSIVDIHNQLPREAVWSLVYESTQEGIRRPQLSVLQAGLFYLHGMSQGHQPLSTAPDAFKWSWLGSLIGMAQNLGLHLETRMCAIPTEEKQLRARLWWALYTEDKWLSLLMGRPPYISHNEWDVAQLEETDFSIPSNIPFTDVSHAELTRPFRDIARLSVIASSVQASFYSLKASQRLSENLSLSIQTAQPIFEQLSLWRASVLAPESPTITTNNGMLNDKASYPATILVAHATLVTYVWRALLRPIVPSAVPPLIVDDQQLAEASLVMELQPHDIENLCWDLPDLSHLELPLRSSIDGTGSHDAVIQNLHQSSLAWATSLSSLVKNLSPARFHEFWYSWSNVCFAVMSSFAMVVFIQSPTQEAALRSRDMLVAWRQIVRDQSKVSPLLLPTLARIDGYFAAGFSDVFSLPAHVKAALQP